MIIIILIVKMPFVKSKVAKIPREHGEINKGDKCVIIIIIIIIIELMKIIMIIKLIITILKNSNKHLFKTSSMQFLHYNTMSNLTIKGSLNWLA